MHTEFGLRRTRPTVDQFTGLCLAASLYSPVSAGTPPLLFLIATPRIRVTFSSPRLSQKKSFSRTLVPSLSQGPL